MDHAYGGDLGVRTRVVVPPVTEALLGGGRAMAKVLGGVLTLVTQGTPGAPARPLTGRRLLFGIHTDLPAFQNVTALPAGQPSATLLFRRTPASSTLTPLPPARLVGTHLRYTVQASTRPVTITLRNEAGGVVLTQSHVGTEAFRVFDLGGLPVGRYELRESVGGGSSWVYLCPDLVVAAPLALVEIDVDAASYAAPLNLTLAFEAKQQSLEYYVVATGLTPAQLNQVQVVDTGAAADGRDAIPFTRIISTAFGATELPLDTLKTRPTDSVVLFRSPATTPRSANPRHGIQLRRNGDVVIANLPQPGPERTTAHHIIHLSSP